AATSGRQVTTSVGVTSQLRLMIKTRASSKKNSPENHSLSASRKWGGNGTMFDGSTSTRLSMRSTAYALRQTPLEHKIVRLWADKGATTLVGSRRLAKSLFS